MFFSKFNTGKDNSNLEISREIDQFKNIILNREKDTKNDYKINSFKKVKLTQKRIYKKIKNEKRISNIEENCKTVVVTGSFGAGKSMVSSVLANVIGLQNKKVLLIDFDIFNSSINTIFGINKYPRNYKKLNFESLITKISNNLDVICPTDTFFSENSIIRNDEINKIFKILKEKYEFIVIDTSSNMHYKFVKTILSKGDKIIFLVEPNLSEIKKSNNLLEIFLEDFNIDVDKIKIVFNKEKEIMSSLELEVNNNLEKNKSKTFSENILEAQKTFLESDIGKAVNTAVDIGIKAALPDLIEDQIIDIKNAILEQGFKEGIKEIINTGIEFGKSAIGIITGNFENVSQIQMAVKKGGILDNVSDLLDLSIKFAKNKKLINGTTANLIKQSKNSIINSVSSKIEETLTNQIKAVEKLENYCEKWKISYENKDFKAMEKDYKNIENYIKKTVPLEKTINEARKIENIHNLIKNNGKDFNISEDEWNLAKKLA